MLPFLGGDACVEVEWLWCLSSTFKTVKLFFKVSEPFYIHCNELKFQFLTKTCYDQAIIFAFLIAL